jgi:alkylhydroperoxidase/carboxymuconolactone decarboxylase family protein YurZ
LIFPDTFAAPVLKLIFKEASMNNNSLTSRVLAVALLASLAAAGCGRPSVTTNSNGNTQPAAPGPTPATAAQDTAATPAATTPAPAGVVAAANPAATANPAGTPGRPANARAASTPPPQIGSGGNDFYAFTQARAALAADEEMKNAPVVIEIRAGVATLTGTVAGDSQKQKAERLVRGAQGVKGVNNQLRVSAGAAK